MKLAFITDEVTQSFAKAVSFAKLYGFNALELRTIENTPIDAVPFDTLRQWKDMLQKEHLEICSLASSFYKCQPLPEVIDNELAKLSRLCDIADILNCRFIRGFTFFANTKMPFAAQDLKDFFIKPQHILKAHGKTLLLEADPSVNTPTHLSLSECIKEIDSSYIRAIFDPGNSLYSPIEEQPYPNAYSAIMPYTSHIHIKDAVRGQNDAVCVKFGTGQVNYPALIKRLVADNYEGYLSMETHYRIGALLTSDQLRTPGGADFSADGEEATIESYLALKELLAAEGIT